MAQIVLDREFLEIRAKILQLAAALDRIDRSDEPNPSDLRIKRIRAGLEVLVGDHSRRAEQVQMIFSREYDPQWKNQFENLAS